MKKRLRDRWDSRTAFILAAIGSAIGLGNVWRFPFVCQQNGGGAFLVPYFIALVTAGIPIMMLEFALGAKMQAGAAKAFKKLKGGFEFLGWWAILISAVIVFYYCAIMAWAWNYLYHSFNLSWQGNEADFFYKEVLQLTESPGDLGGIPMPLILGLALTWIIVFLCLIKGAKSVGKVVLITVPLPWLLLIVLFFRGMTLPGAMDGVKYYLTPDWSALLKPSTWLAAYGQIFFSLSLAFGVMITYASFLPKRSDINNNAFITSFANCGTSFFAGFVVFSVIGFLAMTAGIDPSNVSGGVGLAFVTYPTAISHLPALQVMVGVFFFLMLLTLGIDSAFSLVEAVSTSFAEKLSAHKLTVTAVFCVIGFLVGLIFITRAGLLWLDIVDHYINNFAVTVVGLLECVFIGWFGYFKFLKNHVNAVSEFKAGLWWDIFVKVITPIVLIIIIVLAFNDDFKAPYGASSPPEAEAFVTGEVSLPDGLEEGEILVLGLMVKEHELDPLTGNVHGAAPLKVYFDASRIAAEDAIVKYEWDWNGDGKCDESSTDPVIEHTYEYTGNYTAMVAATDANGVVLKSAIGIAAGYSLWSRIAGGWAIVGGIIVLAIILSLIKDRKPAGGEMEVRVNE